MEKLRTEQRKLWRKTFHQERDRGVVPDLAAKNADEAVRAWEERGAFDEEQLPCVRPFWDANTQRLVSWVLVIIWPDGATLFAGDALTDEHGQRWLLADTATYRDGEIVRMSSEDSAPRIPSFGSPMLFVSPRVGCVAKATYVGGEMPALTRL